MDVRNLYKKDNKFISIIPGFELSECIEAVVGYCRENNTTAFLEFNGKSNRIESWIDPKKLADVWFTIIDGAWYDQQKRISRDEKIRTVLGNE